MSNINFTCPHCSLITQLGSDRVGTKGICPSCKMQVVITPEPPNPPPLSKPPPINPITDESDCEVQNEVWKQPVVIGVSILSMTGVVVFLLCVILGACFLLLINRDAGDEQSSLIEPDIIKVTLLKTINGHKGNITSAVFSPDGSRIVTGSEDMTAKIWDSNTGDELQTLVSHRRKVIGVAFSSDGNRVVTGSTDQTLRTWNVHTGKLIETDNTHDSLECVTYSPDGTKIACGGVLGLRTIFDRGFRVFIYSADPLRLQRTLTGNTEVKIDFIYSVVFSSDSQRIATGGTEGKVRIWDAHTGKALTALPQEQTIASIAFSPDGKQIVSASKDTIKISLWNVNTGELLEMLKGHAKGVTSVAFSPDGSQIVSGSLDKTIKVWDASTAQLLATLNGHTAQVNSVTFSPDGKRIVSVSDDETVRIWSVEK